jgi:predicted RNA-binding Zn-ribbon protein involved in translation (DUF1610 family)
MPLHSATPVVLTFARYFARPACPACGEEQFVPEASEFVGEGVIRHSYTCDACGHEFRTVLEFGCQDA